jgi:hypothetical protein
MLLILHFIALQLKLEVPWLLPHARQHSIVRAGSGAPQHHAALPPPQTQTWFSAAGRFTVSLAAEAGHALADLARRVSTIVSTDTLRVEDS